VIDNESYLPPTPGCRTVGAVSGIAIAHLTATVYLGSLAPLEQDYGTSSVWLPYLYFLLQLPLLPLSLIVGFPIMCGIWIVNSLIWAMALYGLW
jgi:hypothetical protein